MKINLTPVHMASEPLTASVSGDVITVNGVPYDLSPLGVGEELPAESPFSGNITRDEAGVIHLTLMLPHGANAPEETRFPVAYIEAIDVTNGDVPVPPYDVEVEAYA